MPFDRLQAEQIELFREAWTRAQATQGEPRVSVSRTVIPITSDLDRRLFGDDCERGPGRLARRSDQPSGAATPGSRTGSPRSSHGDAAVQAADTILLTVPSQLGVDYNAAMLETITREIAPAIGWIRKSAPETIGGPGRSTEELSDRGRFEHATRWIRNRRDHGRRASARARGRNRIPFLGLGVWQIPDGPEVRERRPLGLRARVPAHRHRAALREREERGSAGFARRRAARRCPRHDQIHRASRDPVAAAEGSLERLGLEQVDLYLVHWPEGGPYLGVAGDGSERTSSGYARSIGVSNFDGRGARAAACYRQGSLRS